MRFVSEKLNVLVLFFRLLSRGAGVAYYLLTLYHFTQDSSFLQARPSASRLNGSAHRCVCWQAALSGAQYLLAIANTDNGGCVIHMSPQDATMYYLGECNGPPGTGRLWVRLYQVWRSRVRSLLLSISCPACHPCFPPCCWRRAACAVVHSCCAGCAACQVTGNSTWLYWAQASGKSLIDHGKVCERCSVRPCGLSNHIRTHAFLL